MKLSRACEVRVQFQMECTLKGCAFDYAYANVRNLLPSPNVTFKSALALPAADPERAVYLYETSLQSLLYGYFCVTDIQIITELLE